MAHIHTMPRETVHEGMVLVPIISAENMERVKSLEAVDGDVLVSSYPKTGTTWMSELVSIIAEGGDTTQAISNKHQAQRVIYLEFKLPIPQFTFGMDVLETADRPALMKTHVPARYLEKQVNEGKIKVILLIRNPKDTLVSMYHFYRNHPALGNFQGTFHEWFGLYEAKHMMNGDYFDWYEGWLSYVGKPNVLLVSYEEMKQDLASVITKLSNFMGKDVPRERYDAIIEHMSVESFKANKMINMQEMMKHFIRKGQVGDWRNHFTPEQSRLVDEEYQKRIEAKGFKLLFELDDE